MADAPGNGTSTLAIVTLICGSSSLGVTSTANSAEQEQHQGNQRRELTALEKLAMRPEMPMSARYAASFSFLIPMPCSTSFSYSGSVVPRFILRMK